MMFGELQALRDRAIPTDLKLKSGYRAVPIDTDGAANAEPLVDATQAGLAGANFYAGTRNPPYYRPIPGAIDRLLLRRGVVEQLQRVNARLRSAELELWLFDGWRPQAVQIYFHDHWFPAELRRRNPGISDDDLLAEVETYWAAPSAGEDAPSPHATGGAVDLTIRWRGGEPLWMGSLFDDVSAIAHTAHFETPRSDHFSFSADEARANRRLLFWLMTDAGLASNPSEWWHFSYGDQMWAKLTGAPAALYAGTEPTA
ncbi:MAG: M15 family metallopeptidase [Hyphomonadaceae bacterium]|nr:M15 family metallopeptidase [Hyphomonadaceae bacterium]